MRNILIAILLLFSIQSNGQDTTIVKKVKASWYMRTMPASLYTGAGFLSSKISQNIEGGVSYGVIDAGIAIGRINQKADSNKYAEFRCTMDASQMGKISSEITIGAGYVFNSSTPIMLEISYTIFYQIHKRYGIGVVTGYYDFGGNYNDVSKTFFGLFLRYGLFRDMNGILNKKIKMHHSGR